MSNHDHAQAIIREGLIKHRCKSRNRITEVCVCSANVLDHDTHRATEIVDMLDNAGLLK